MAAKTCPKGIKIYEIDVCTHELCRGFGPVRGRSRSGTGFAGSPAYPADISLLENPETGEAVRTPRSRRACDHSSDAIAKTVQGAETMGNGLVRGRELLHAPQERQTSNKQRQGSVSWWAQQKQGTMIADSGAGAAVQSQLVPESEAIGSSSRTNPLANSGGQTVGRSQEGGRVKSRNVEMDSGPQSHKTLEGKELETNVTDGNKMGTRYNRRVKLQLLEGVGFSAQEYQSQLDRFLAKLMQADQRLIGSSAGHRIQVVDCRIGVAGEVGMDAATNAIYGRLTALLMQTDPWEVRFESLEEFVREHQRLPRRRGKDNFEASLSNWWTSQHRSLKLGHRLQQLQSTSVALIQQRVEKWLAGGPEAIFKQKCQDLRRHMQKHNRLPSVSSPDPKTRKLGDWLWNLRRGSPRSRVREINALKAVHPLVKQLFQFDRHPLKIQKVPWYKQFEDLSTFVRQHGRLPRMYTSSKSEGRLYKWLWRQRSRICSGNLPENFVAALQDAHPLLSSAVAIAESNSLNMRSDKEHQRTSQVI